MLGVGMQEYIEAVALWHYMAKGNIIGLNDIQERLTFTQARLKCIVQGGPKKTDTQFYFGITSVIQHRFLRAKAECLGVRPSHSCKLESRNLYCGLPQGV